MRLLKRERSGALTDHSTFSLVDYDPRAGDRHYAILSHRWEKDEVTYQDIQQGTASKKAGYKKLEFCADQAERDGLLYFWVDTCCIDKTNNTELSEAINSMYKWYRDASKCYVYLTDISTTDQDWQQDFQQSDWFRRGWTLQELIAPRIVEFFSAEGTKLVDKISLLEQVHQATGISNEVLEGKSLSDVSERERFSWTTRRQTTVEEDAVYCLLGIFNVFMPLIYGEGAQNALTRLQREIRLLANPDLYAANPAVWEVPFERNPNFIEREGLAELEGRLGQAAGVARVALVGLGGVGKTQLALEVIYRYRELHEECSIMWIAATSTESIEQGYLSIAQQLKIANCEHGKTDTKKLVQNHLSSKARGPWLLVFDSADDLDVWTGVLTPLRSADGETQSSVSPGRPQRLIEYLPRHAQGQIIFTTRSRKVAVALATTNIITIPAMSETTAEKLLAVSLYGTYSPSDVPRFLVSMTYLPLAITQATAYINANGITLAEYLSLLEEREEVVIDLLSENFEDHTRYTDTKNPIAATWLVSFEQIRKSDPLAAEYLSFMACIGSRDIPQSLLPPAASRKKELDAIGTLTAYSFVTRRSESSMLDMHRLVHLATRNWLRMQGSLAECTENAISRAAEVFPIINIHHRSIWREYLPHVQQLLLACDVLSVHDHRRELLPSCGMCLLKDGRYNEAAVMFEKLLAIERTTDDPESDHITTCMDWLARAFFDGGQFSEAGKLMTQILERLRAKHGTEHPETLSAMEKLGRIYNQQSRFQEAPEAAKQLKLQIQQVREKIYGEYPHLLGNAASLAIIYGNQGRIKEAEMLQLKILGTQQKMLGEDHHATLAIEASLAITYRKQERHAEAEQLEVHVYEARKTQLGVEHADTLDAMACLVLTLRAQNKFIEAERLQSQGVELNKATLGVNHPETLLSMDLLAIIWWRLSYHEKALRLLRESLQRRATVLGQTHPDYIRSHTVMTNWESQICTVYEEDGR